MRASYVTVKLPLPPSMADLPEPGPTPIPIRIINDFIPPPPPPDDLIIDRPPSPASVSGPRGANLKQSSKRNDAFYPSWDKFLALEPNRAKRLSTPARKLEQEKKAVECSEGEEGLQVQENAATSWEQAAEACRSKVKAIVEECRRLNQKYRDAIFDLEANPFCLQSLHGRLPKAVDKIDAPPWIKRVEDIFDNPQFFIDGATAQDVHQGSGGDCWFLAALMAVSAKKELIEQLCVARDEAAGVYGFVFYRDGEWIPEVIDDKLFLRVGDDDNLQVVRDWEKGKKEGMPIPHPDDDALLNQLQRGGEALYFSHCKSSETWLPLIEKAYAKAHGDYYAIEGGYASEAIEDLTGGVGVVINPEDIMDKERFWREQLSQVNVKYLFGGGSKSTGGKGFIGGHAYAVLRVFEEGDLKLLKLRNPWGETEWEGDWSDGSKKWTPEMMTKLEHTFGDDGVFWISYKDFLKHFPSINRLRLFDKNWHVAQQWTAVNVPWTVDYLDTKFQFTITKKAPVVIVLSQPDDRYFYGLRGRFLYSLHFRVYREGDDPTADSDSGAGKWLVRSMHNSGNETVFTRSVSAEIEDLEPGTYSVVFKVTAVRSQQVTAEEAIMKYAVDRKEKLLHVGRRYDYAQTKGNLRGMEEFNRKRKGEQRWEARLGVYKRARKLNMKERERARARKKRINEAMKEKRREFETKRRERRERRYEEGSREDKGSEGVTPGTTEDEPTKAELGDGVKDEEAAMAQAEGKAVPVQDPKASKPQEDAPEHGTAKVRGAAEASKIAETPVYAEQTGAQSTEGISKSDERKAEFLAGEHAPAIELPEEEPIVRLGEHDPTTDGDLSKDLSNLKVTDDEQANAVSPVASDSQEYGQRAREDDDYGGGYESPLEAPDELDDDDFEWDSEIDGPIDSSEEDDALRQNSSATSGRNELFADDPWNAVCVLGLRVYALHAEAKVKVVKAEGGS